MSPHLQLEIFQPRLEQLITKRELGNEGWECHQMPRCFAQDLSEEELREALVYSYRSATIGSTRMARRAGTKHAATATSVSRMATPAIVAGSFV